MFAEQGNFSQWQSLILQPWVDTSKGSNHSWLLLFLQNLWGRLNKARGHMQWIGCHLCPFQWRVVDPPGQGTTWFHKLKVDSQHTICSNKIKFFQNLGSIWNSVGQGKVAPLVHIDQLTNQIILEDCITIQNIMSQQQQWQISFWNWAQLFVLLPWSKFQNTKFSGSHDGDGGKVTYQKRR